MTRYSGGFGRLGLHRYLYKTKCIHIGIQMYRLHKLIYVYIAVSIYIYTHGPKAQVAVHIWGFPVAVVC